MVVSDEQQGLVVASGDRVCDYRSSASSGGGRGTPDGPESSSDCSRIDFQLRPGETIRLEARLLDAEQPRHPAAHVEHGQLLRHRTGGIVLRHVQEGSPVLAAVSDQSTSSPHDRCVCGSLLQLREAPLLTRLQITCGIRTIPTGGDDTGLTCCPKNGVNSKCVTIFFVITCVQLC